MTGQYEPPDWSTGGPQLPPPEPPPASWSQYPSPGAPWPVPPTPPRRATPTWAWVLISVVVIVAGVILSIAFVGGGSNSPKDAPGTGGRTLAAPLSVGAYAQITSIDPHQLAEQLSGKLASVGTADLIDKAAVGVYGRHAAPEIVFLGFELADAPELKGQVADEGVKVALDDFSAGLTKGTGGPVTSPMHPVDAGPLGGFMKCGAVTVSGRPVGICAWGDRSAFAMTMVVDPLSDADAAQLTLETRAAAEQ